MKTPLKMNSASGKLVSLLHSESDLLRLGVITLVILVAMSAVTGGRLLSTANFVSMGFQLPELALLSLAVMLAMLTGGIDLSVVAIANLAGVTAAVLLTETLSEDASTTTTVLLTGVAAVTALLTGGVCGVINGLLVSRCQIPAILTTLGTMELFTGVTLVATGGKAVTGMPKLVQEFGNGTLLGMPIPFLMLALIAGTVWILSARTPFGLRQRLIGSNPVAAAFSGISVPSILVRTYLICGILAGMTGLMMIARTNSAKANYGSSYLLQAILVVVLGGVNPAGGFGSVRGLVLAVLSLQFLASGFNILHFSNFSKEFIWGLFLLSIMILNQLTQQHKRR